MEIMFRWKSEDRIIKWVHLIMISLFFLLSIYTIMQNVENQFVIGLCLISYLVLTIFRHLSLSNMKGNLLHFAFPYLELSVIYIANLLDTSGVILPIFILIIWDVVIDYVRVYGICFSIVGYFCYMFKYTQISGYLPLANIIFMFIIAAFQFALFVGFAFLAKLYNIKSRDLKNTTAELQAKMLSTEQVTLLNERNRIAGEIHNTVGHQLTTALVQIEATQMILDKDPEEAKRRLAIIKTQVKDGLNELRKSIHAINADEEYENFSKAVELLIQQVESYTQLSICYELDNIEHIKLNYKKVLYHIVLESITNGIRHGHCKKIRIKICENRGIITLTSYNDGLVPEDLKYGYGLSQLNEKIETLGGSLLININEEGWFGLIVKLPLYIKEGVING